MRAFAAYRAVEAAAYRAVEAAAVRIVCPLARSALYLIRPHTATG